MVHCKLKFKQNDAFLHFKFAKNKNELVKNCEVKYVSKICSVRTHPEKIFRFTIRNNVYCAN